jgi:hypothetical protein
MQKSVAQLYSRSSTLDEKRVVSKKRRHRIPPLRRHPCLPKERLMTKHKYRPIEEAPKDGTPIVQAKIQEPRHDP